MTGSHFSERAKEGKGAGELKELWEGGSREGGIQSLGRREGFSHWEGGRDSVSEERKGVSEEEGGIKWVIRGREGLSG